MQKYISLKVNDVRVLTLCVYIIPLHDVNIDHFLYNFEIVSIIDGNVVR